MTHSLMPVPKLQFLDNDGRPLAAGLVYLYEAGTTTPLDTYDDAGAINPNPVVLDAGGFASIWITSAFYKVTVKASDGTLLYTIDNVSASGQVPSDSVLPSAPLGPSVTSHDGIFVGDWLRPAAGYNTLDDLCIQYDTVDTFNSADLNTSIGWGPIFHREGYDPNKIYYFRFAWHNQSGVASNTTTKAAIVAGTGDAATYGWGPFSSSVGPISSYPDSVIPTAPVDAAVTVKGGTFVGDWKNPVTGYASLDDVCIQFATNAGFTTGVDTSIGWGKCNHQEGYDPGKTYYFRFAWHNQSHQASDATTIAAIVAAGYDTDTGWGPFCAAIGPITSGDAVTQDTVIPGVPTNAALTADGAEFVATWGNPATGANTLCDVCVQYDVVATFDSADLVTIAGLGKINTKRGIDPARTYYFRYAWRNQSGVASNSTTAAAITATGHTEWLPTTGWGPFCAALGPVTSGYLTLGMHGAGSDPTTSDIPSGCVSPWHDSTGYHFWINDGGVMRSL